jgi:hypothetical protein
MGSTLYDGVRHLQFITPIMVTLAVAGWTGVLIRSRPPWLRAGAPTALAIGLTSLIVFDIRYHPNQGVYFNGLVGGPRRAYARYDLDYWGNCMLQGVEWAVERARSYGTVVTISGNPWHLVQLDAERFREVSFTHPSSARHHVEVRLARGAIKSLRHLTNEPALYQVRTPDGALLCTVTPGPAFGEIEARRGAAREATQAKPQ